MTPEEIERLKKLASGKLEKKEDVGLDEAQRFLNFHKIKAGSKPVMFTLIYWSYVEWRKSENQEYISRKEFGKHLKRYLKSGVTKRGASNYTTYYVEWSREFTKREQLESWKLLWYEQEKNAHKKKKVRKPRSTI